MTSISEHSEDFFFLIDHNGHRRVPVKINTRDGRHGYALHPKGKGNDASTATYTDDQKRLVQAVVLEGLGTRCRAQTGPQAGQQNTLALSGRVVQGYWLKPELRDWITGAVVAPTELEFRFAQVAAPAIKNSLLGYQKKDVPCAPYPAPRHAEPVHPRAGEFHSSTDIRFADHCCQGGPLRLPQGSFTLDDLTLMEEGPRRLRFSPLGNRPAHPRVALVGITPGGQVEKFAKLLKSMPVEDAAKEAAFDGAQPAIKQLLAAHDLARKIGLRLDGDLNDNPEVLTTSIVKCCLMVDEGYRFSAPDIGASAAATHCATRRFVDELLAYSTLKWVLVFGEPGWTALHELRRDGQRLIDVLTSAGLNVLQLPHFAQNFQQRALFACSNVEEEELLQQRPHYEKFAPAARQMRSAVIEALCSSN